MARTAEQLDAWRLLLEVCEDECQVLRLFPDLRASVLEVERELSRLHEIERNAIGLACLLKRWRDADPATDGVWEEAMDDLWTHNEVMCRRIEELVPEAFTPEAMLEAVALKERSGHNTVHEKEGI